MLHNVRRDHRCGRPPPLSCRVGAKGPGPPPVPLPRLGPGHERRPPSVPKGDGITRGRGSDGGMVSAMVTARSPKTHHHNGNGSVHDDAPVSRVAVFVDLDRTLLRGASGLVLSAAMHAEGLFEGRRSLPGERLFYGIY